MKTLLIINGYSGTGKTTVSKLFAQQHKFALINQDYFQFGVNAAGQPPRHLTKDEKEIAFEDILDIAENYMEKSHDILIEGALVSISPENPVNILALETLGKKHDYRTVRVEFIAKDSVTMGRMKERGIVVQKDSYEKLKQAAKKEESLGVHVIDTSEKTPEQVLKVIEEIIFNS